MSWAHDWLFSNQDKWIVEAIRPGPEMLSKTDVGVVAWRWFATKNARGPALPESGRLSHVAGTRRVDDAVA
jgi:hypothetical protein